METIVEAVCIFGGEGGALVRGWPRMREKEDMLAVDDAARIGACGSGEERWKG